MRGLLIGLGLILALLSGFLALAAFADAAARCPGYQCDDARQVGAIYASITAITLLALALPLLWRLFNWVKARSHPR